MLFNDQGHRFYPRDQYDQTKRTNKRFGDANVNCVNETIDIHGIHGCQCIYSHVQYIYIYVSL